MKELEATVSDMPEAWIYWSVFYRTGGGAWLVNGPYTTDTEAITMAMTLVADEKKLVSTELPL